MNLILIVMFGMIVKEQKDLNMLWLSKKTDNGANVDPKKLEKILIDNSISVRKTFELPKSTDMGLVVNSKEHEDLLIEKLGDALPEHKTSVVSNRILTITIVGLERNFSNEEITTMIVNQNPGISAIRQSNGTSP